MTGLEAIDGILFALILGAFAWAEKIRKDCATKEDVAYIRDRLDKIYDKLINGKNPPKEEVKK